MIRSPAHKNIVNPAGQARQPRPSLPDRIIGHQVKSVRQYEHSDRVAILEEVSAGLEFEGRFFS